MSRDVVESRKEWLLMELTLKKNPQRTRPFIREPSRDAIQPLVLLLEENGRD